MPVGMRNLGRWPKDGRGGQTTQFNLSIMLWFLLVLLANAPMASAMSSARISSLRQQTVEMFYHGFSNYMKISFPEDELRPVSCIPLTRDARNPRNVELNDVLGNYSLTLIDSLSTLAILASAPEEDGKKGRRSLDEFQNGVAALVQQYGDGRPGKSGLGLRARGFDLDSKVQVFETVIRGVGGLLSAHEFAVGELPIAGYHPPRPNGPGLETPVIRWPNGFRYDGQLLRLALDLAQRLLPAFYTRTGMPYPRVNLRHGIPFYINSPLHDMSPVFGTYSGPPEITETCSAGAGSLVLEFTVLSRLTGDSRFEELAKRAFWAVWYRKSQIGLIGAGVDAEQGHWIGSYAVIGAGADSFFEYALKSHILLSGQDMPNRTVVKPPRKGKWLDPNSLFHPLSDMENSADSFLEAWQHAHSAIKRHLYSDREHPHYKNVNLYTGSLVSNWVDSLGAFYSGLLTLAGELEEAMMTNLLYTAIWTKYAAIPERWSVREKTVEGGLGWWPLRPEFIESTYYLYRATKDPWYLYVGEMVQRDIMRRCWTNCGFSGLQDVLNGEHSDRMESFFLGETAKYMYLMYDEEHPLNKMDAAFVFTTEGHPLILPPKSGAKKARRRSVLFEESDFPDEAFSTTCPAPQGPPPLTGSVIAARKDVYHAARLLDLHLLPEPKSRRKQYGSVTEGASTNFFPWTLPDAFLPDNGTCAKVYEPIELNLDFPTNAQHAVDGSAFNFLMGQSSLDRLSVDRIRVTSMSGLKLTLKLEGTEQREWRVTKLNGLQLGRDEFAVFDRSMLGDISDLRFNLVRDPVVVKLQHLHRADTEVVGAEEDVRAALEIIEDNNDAGDELINVAALVKSLFRRIVPSLDRSRQRAAPAPDSDPAPGAGAFKLPFDLVLNKTAVTAVGVGATPLPADTSISLPWTTIYDAGDACNGVLPEEASRDHQVIVMRRGGCSFSEKLASIPAYLPSRHSLQLVVMVSPEPDDRADYHNYATSNVELTRPLLDEIQVTPKGLNRHHLIPMVMLAGGEVAHQQLVMADRIGLMRRYYIESQGMRVSNIIVDEGEIERTL